MRPQDIVVLLKIHLLGEKSWYNSDLAKLLYISPSEISEILNRCKIARLIDSSKRKVNRTSFFEFLIYGLKYVFPAELGAIVKGIPTAHSAPPLNDVISAENNYYVWKHAEGTHRGQEIEPLYKKFPKVAQEDQALYELLALIDSIRIGKAREVNIATEELKKRLIL